MRKFLLLIFFAAASAASAQLTDIPGLFNTGLDDFSTLLPDGATDPHYMLVSSPDATYPGPESKTVLSDGFPMNCWLPNSAQSRWIAPRSDAGAPPDYNAKGMYVYRLRFDLTHFKPNTARISGLWSTDNNGVDILINGKRTGFFTTFEAFRDGMFPFEILTGFKDGVNTIDFVVNNDFAPTGLRVEIKGTAESKEFVMNDKH
jgi:hypothetical protein